MKVRFTIPLCLAAVSCGRFDEIRAKPEWSIVSAAEYTYRGSKGARVVIVESNGYHLVGIRSEAVASVRARPPLTHVWVMLDAKTKPLVKRTPNVDYAITERELSRIMQTGVVTPEVARELRAHCCTVGQN